MSILVIGELFNTLELPVHIFRHKKDPADNAEAIFESDWRLGRSNSPEPYCLDQNRGQMAALGETTRQIRDSFIEENIPNET